MKRQAARSDAATHQPILSRRSEATYFIPQERSEDCMKTVDRGRYGPWEPMQGARGRAEAIQNEQSVAQSEDKRNASYRAAVRNPGRVKPAQLRRARQAARKGLTYGSNPDTADKASPF